MSLLKRRVLMLFASISLFVLGMVGAASTWQGSFSDPLAQSVSAAEKPQAEAPAAPMLAPGVCDTAGPIEVEGSILGTTPTAYATLQLAFAAINAGTHTGAITIDVCGDSTETVTSLLNASGVGSSSYTSIVMSPAGGAARTISGAIAAGSPLIDLSGAEQVNIKRPHNGRHKRHHRPH